MGRYANYSQEVLYRNGKLAGFNAGYAYHTEHETGYRGMEQTELKKSGRSKRKDNNSNHPFNGEIVINPELIHFMEFDDGTVWIKSGGLYNSEYERLKRLSNQEKYARMRDVYINNYDRENYEKMCRKYGREPETPEIISLWDDNSFDLISTSTSSSEILRTLYNEIQKGNVAISGDYSFMFKDRGLSFVLLDQLTQEDLMNKQLVDHSKEMSRNFQKQYNEFLIEEGLAGYGVEMKYPLRFANVQTTELKQTEKGLSPEFYLELYHIDHGEWNNDSCLFNVKHRMSGDEIKFLVPIAKSKEFEEFANNHSKEDIEAYINQQLEEYHEQQKIAEEQGYEIGQDSLESISTEQRTETVEKRRVSLKERISKWLHHDRENNKDKSEVKGE